MLNWFIWNCVRKCMCIFAFLLQSLFLADWPGRLNGGMRKWGAEFVWEKRWVIERSGLFWSSFDMGNAWLGSGWSKEFKSLRWKREGIEAGLVWGGETESLELRDAKVKCMDRLQWWDFVTGTNAVWMYKAWPRIPSKQNNDGVLQRSDSPATKSLGRAEPITDC